LDFNLFNLNIYFKHAKFKENQNIKLNSINYNFDDNDGMDYFVQTNLCKKEEIIYLKINGKYFKFNENNITKVTINLKSFTDIINLEINNGLKLDNFSLILGRYLHEFFEGNTISG